jgi:tetratricopeptide (TPR) repeat protein
MMTNALRLTIASILALLAFTNFANAHGGGRGGGMVGRGGGGGGNFSRPANVSQNFSRPANVSQNVNRPTNVNQNGNRPTNINQNVNRPTNINQNVNRPTNINNNNVLNNRPTTINNVHVNNVNNVNNVNRGGYHGYGVGYGGAGGYRGWGGGYGGYGAGYHANSYYGYHSNWVNGSWGGAYRPGWGGYPGYYGGYYGNNFGTALGIGAGIGIAAWGIGSLVNSWGYSSYSNPYYSSLYGGQQGANFAQTASYDYSRPLNLASAPPSDQVMQTAEAGLDTARQAFYSGDYVQALALADQALAQNPNDPMLHEFRATCLFAQRRYDEAAVPFYTVLSSGPGWDWTTMIGLYPDVNTYTQQLRALEAYCNANGRAASARFVLAALYLTQGSTAAAATRLREVIAIQPQDKLSAQLLAAVTAESQPSQVANQAQPANPVQPTSLESAPTNPTPAQGPPLPTGPVPTNLIGSWTASPAKDVTISLTLNGDKSFTWKVVEKGQTREFKGEASSDDQVLALVASEIPPMIAKVTWKDPAHFNFKAVATPADDPGLDFGK